MNSWSMVLEQIDKLRPKYDMIEKNIHNGIMLWGAGQFGRTSLEYLKKQGYAVTSFIDSSPQKQGLTIDDIPVIPPPPPRRVSCYSNYRAA
jgi:FlaA1/EpsC-like NDP-sugar epimerase